MMPPFRRVAILGCGLIGGSFALALRRAFPEIAINGWDRDEVLARARERAAIDDGSTDLGAACREADLVYVALPVEVIVHRLPEIAAAAPAQALVTDAASTKTAVCERARLSFFPPRLFLGGHPIAGRERGGIDHADPDLFRNATYVLIGQSGEREPSGEEAEDARIPRFIDVIHEIGAQPTWLDAAAHDRLFAFLSHLPQLASIALAETVLEGAGDAAATLAGPGLADSLRLAGSPYELWEGICRTSPALDDALARLIATLERIRSGLATGALGDDFARAARLYTILRHIE
ncbi:MAG: prephenate dehydrogenase/arogenate dehydrogenase family protein [Acidobacteriota bacterium]|nr:prephenate dehydrogenase/arogenate dehydrogenase family protein [Acidobacteriota bacterium]